MSASNTRECIEDFIGFALVGVIEGRLPRGDRSIASHCRTLLFSDGRGLTFSSNGSFWSETPSDVDQALSELASELKATQRRLKDVLRAAGVKE